MALLTCIGDYSINRISTRTTSRRIMLARLMVVLFVGVILPVAQGAQLTLSWSDNSDNETGFKIERSVLGSAFVEIARVSANVKAWVDANVVPGITYSYKVRAYNAYGNSGYSGIASGTAINRQLGQAIEIQTDQAAATYGDTITLSAAFSGSQPTSVKWFFNGQLISGTSGTTYTISRLYSSNQGTYDVLVSWGDGSLSVASFDLYLEGLPPSNVRLQSLSTRAWVGDGDRVLISGFAITGTGSKRLLVRAVGPTLSGAPFNLSGTLSDPRIVLTRWNGTSFDQIASNGDWGSNSNADEIRSTSVELSAFALPDGSLGAGLLLDLVPGQYSLLTMGENNATGVAIAEIYDADQGSTASEVKSLSNRGFVGNGNSVMIPGFAVSGNGSKTFLIRAVGPRLAEAPFNLQGILPDPVITLYRHNTGGSDSVIRTNDDWDDNPSEVDSIESATRSVYAFRLTRGSRDAAILVTLQSGVYTAVVSESRDRTGIAIVELYTVD